MQEETTSVILIITQPKAAARAFECSYDEKTGATALTCYSDKIFEISFALTKDSPNSKLIKNDYLQTIKTALNEALDKVFK